MTFCGGGVHHVLRPDQNTVRNIQQSERVRDLADGGHAASDQRYFAAELRRKIQHQLNSVDRRAETRNDQPPLGAIEDVFHAGPHGALGFGVAWPVRIGRIRKQQQHAALAVVGQRVQIEQLVIRGGGIDLEIAGVNDHSKRRGNGQRHRADNRVRYMNELDFERTDLQYLLRLDSD